MEYSLDLVLRHLWLETIPFGPGASSDSLNSEVFLHIIIVFQKCCRRELIFLFLFFFIFIGNGGDFYKKESSHMLFPKESCESLFILSSRLSLLKSRSYIFVKMRLIIIHKNNCTSANYVSF